MMKKNNDDIESITPEPANTADPVEPVDLGTLMAKRSDESIADIAIPDRTLPARIYEWLWDTARGETVAGRIAGAALEIIDVFIPAVGRARRKLKPLIFNKPTIMKKTNGKLSKTIIIFGLLFIAGVLQAVGVDLGLTLSPDAQWVLMGASAIGFILRFFTRKPLKVKNKSGGATTSMVLVVALAGLATWAFYPQGAMALAASSAAVPMVAAADNEMNVSQGDQFRVKAPAGEGVIVGHPGPSDRYRHVLIDEDGEQTIVEDIVGDVVRASQHVDYPRGANDGYRHVQWIGEHAERFEKIESEDGESKQ